MGHQIEGGPLAHRHDDAHIGAAHRRAHRRAGGGAGVDAAAEHALHGQTGFEENDFGVDSLIAEKAALQRHPKRQVQRAARNHGDANWLKLRRLFRG